MKTKEQKLQEAYLKVLNQKERIDEKVNVLDLDPYLDKYVSVIGKTKGGNDFIIVGMLKQEGDNDFTVTSPIVSNSAPSTVWFDNRKVKKMKPMKVNGQDSIEIELN